MRVEVTPNKTKRVMKNEFIPFDSRQNCENEKSDTVLEKKGATIGDRCSIHGSADLGSEPYLIKIGDHVRINAGVSLVTHDGGLWVLRDMESLSTTVYQKADAFGRIQIGNNCHIGTSVLLCLE